MDNAILVVFMAGLVLYVAGAVAALVSLGRGAPWALPVARTLTWGGLLMLAITFLLRWDVWQRPPLTTAGDSINLLVLLATVVGLVEARREQMEGLLGFYLPPLAVLYAINAVAGSAFLKASPRELPGVFLTVHVGLAFLAYALFLVASITSVAYVFQVQHLKRRKPSALAMHLPSLEQLDLALYRLIRFGYPLFIVTLVLGVVWAWRDRELLGARWWLAPKVLLSYVMVILYGVSFHSRQVGWLRGRKLAYLVCMGFSSLLAMYLVMSLLGLRNYHFWGVAS